VWLVFAGSDVNRWPELCVSECAEPIQERGCILASIVRVAELARQACERDLPVTDLFLLMPQLSQLMHQHVRVSAGAVRVGNCSTQGCEACVLRDLRLLS
jgi:hypothetical protein